MAIFGKNGRIARGVTRGANSYFEALSGKKVRELKRARKVLKNSNKARMKANAMPDAMNLASLQQKTNSLLEANVANFKKHGDTKLFDSNRKKIMDDYNKKAKRLEASRPGQDFAGKVVGDIEYKQDIKALNRMLMKERGRTLGARGIFAGGSALAYNRYTDKKKERQYKKDRREIARMQVEAMKGQIRKKAEEEYEMGF